MDLENFKELSLSYKSSILDIGISPEYNIGEVSLASLYRQIGWKSINEGKLSRYSEAKVNEAVVNFFRELEENRNEENDLFSNNDFKEMLNGALSTPKMPNQIKSKYPILYPLIPDCTLYSSAARMRGNPWNPGQLIEKVLAMGAKNKDEFEKLWLDLFHALSCESNNLNEDILARALSLQFSNYRSPIVEWSINNIVESIPDFDEGIKADSPAAQFFNDLDKIIKLKNQLARRQWLSILESSIRISCSAHLLWICNLNIIVWNYFKDCLLNDPIDFNELISKIKTESLLLWKIEEKAVPLIKEHIQGFIRAQIGINYLLKKLENEGVSTSFSLKSIKNIFELGILLNQNIKCSKWDSSILMDINLLFEKDTKLISCKSGFTNNLFEFMRYSMGQKQTAELHKRNFDQAYWLRKKGNYSSSPWIFDLGPASIMTMVFCCSFGYDQYRTISDLLGHLNKYGIIISQKDFENSTLFKTLGTLQIVSDSPDAEGGMVILNPFDKVQ